MEWEYILAVVINYHCYQTEKVLIYAEAEYNQMH